MDESVARFLERYGAALSSGEVSVIASCWALPSLVIADEGAIAVTEAGQVAAFFTQAIAQYHARGLVTTTPHLERHEQLSTTLSGAYVRWSARDDAGNERSVERSYYVLQRGDDGALRIRAALTLPPSSAAAAS